MKREVASRKVQRQQGETSQGLIKAPLFLLSSPASQQALLDRSQPHRQGPHDRPSAQAPRADNQVPETQEGMAPTLPTQRRTEERQSLIFPRSWSRNTEWKHLCPRLCSGCGSGHSLGASAGVTLCRGRSGRLRREPLTAAPGDKKPRPDREQGKGLRLG